MEDRKVIITIGRQFGSGGRVIGHKLAERLGIAYYDKELITLASKESGICGEFFEKADEKTSNSLLKAFTMGFSLNSTIFQNNDYLSNESLFQIQSDVIRKVAAEKSCILVGRCADYILRDEIAKAGLDDKIWQYFTVITNSRTVGVQGDFRTYENVIAIRAVTSVDAMTADWARIPYDVLEKISTRIVNEVKHANRWE